MAWTGLAAAALWRAAVLRWRGNALGRFLLAYVVVVALHTAWDTADSTTVYVVLSAVSLALLGITSHRLAAASRRAEVQPGSPLPV
jgi:hypothetical protein